MTFAQRNPQALAALLENVDSASITDETLRGTIDKVKSQPRESLGAGLKIEQNLRAQGTSIGAVMQLADSPQGLVDLLLDSKQRNALFKGNADLIGEAMFGYEKQAAEALPGITDPAQRSAAEAQLNFFRFLNTSAKQSEGPKQAVNVRAIYTLFEEIDGSAFSKSDPANTRKVLTGMLGMITGDKESAKLLTADNVSSFFANEKNAAAFSKFFATINPGRLSATSGNNLRGLVNELKKHWGNRQHGIADILDDRDSVVTMMELAKKPPQPFQSYAGDWGLPMVLNWAGTEFFWNIHGATKDMAENRESIEAITAALRNAGVQSGGAAAPTARPKGQSATVQ
jgi:hypothetical protein